MKTRTGINVLVAAGVSLLIALPASAHHSHASLNKDDVRLYKGRVVKYSWTMPHVFLKIDGTDDDGRGAIIRCVAAAAQAPALRKLSGEHPDDPLVWLKQAAPESSADGDAATPLNPLRSGRAE